MKFKNRIIFQIKFLRLLIFKNNITSYLRSQLKSNLTDRYVRIFDKIRWSPDEKKYYKDCKLKKDKSLKCNSVLFFLITSLSEYTERGNRPNVKNIQKISANKLSTREWLDGYFLFFSSGLIQESLILRNKAITRSFQEYKNDLHNFNYKHLSHCARIELSQFPSDCCYDKIKKVKTNDKKYSELINKNKIAIVGPCEDPSDIEFIKKLSGYNVIIVNNGFGTGEFYNYFQNDKKIVSYYNSYHSKMIYFDQTLLPDKNLDFSIYREYKYKYQVDQAIKGSARLINNNNYFFNGTPMALQAILHDLLHFSPKEIKAFGFNLFSSKNLYNKSYKTAKHQLLYDATRHDLISNFIYTKSIFESGFFKADKTLSAVLGMELSEYLVQIEKNFI